MLQDILGIACPELELAQQLYQFRVNTVHSHVKGGLLPCLAYGGLNLLLYLSDNLFYAGRVNPAVQHKAFKGNAGNLTSDRIEA